MTWLWFATGWVCGMVTTLVGVVLLAVDHDRHIEKVRRRVEMECND